MNLLRQTTFVTFSLALAAVAIFLLGLEPMLQFDRAAIAGGQSWRVFTGHLTHWSFDHLFWDCVMFIALGVLCEGVDRRRLGACIVGSMLAISLALLGAAPDVQSYRGLSGVDSALFVLAAIAILDYARQSNRPVLQVASFVALAAFLSNSATKSSRDTRCLSTRPRRGSSPSPFHMPSAL